MDKDVVDHHSGAWFADDFIQWDACREKYLIDNHATVAEQLKRVGFLPENIQLSDQDTLKMTDGFSYRLDKTPDAISILLLEKDKKIVVFLRYVVI